MAVRRSTFWTAMQSAMLSSPSRSARAIGGSTGVFSVIDAAILRPLPYPDPQRLVRVSVESRMLDGEVARLAPSTEDVEAWRAAADVVSHVTIWREIFQPVIVDGPELERLEGFEISEDFLALHGVHPILGRGITRDDTLTAAPSVVMLGHAYWQRRFGGDPSIIGQTLRVDNTPATIVGVVPSHFYRETPIWVPHKPLGPDARGSGATVYARLQPGVTIENARARLLEIVRARDLAEGRGKDVEGLQVVSVLEEERSGYRGMTKVLAGAVGAILLIACLNVAGLLLARGATRRSELGVRASLGASRMRLIRQLLAESLVLALAGGAAGVLLAWITLDTLVASIPLDLPANSPPELNVRVLGFSGALAIITGLLFGLAPAWSLSRVDVTALSRVEDTGRDPRCREDQASF